MGVLSNKDMERDTSDREEIKIPKVIPKYNKDYEKFRQRYRSTSPRRPIEPKGWQDEKEEKEIEIEELGL